MFNLYDFSGMGMGGVIVSLGFARVGISRSLGISSLASKGDAFFCVK
jgi:hypothetical protein